MREDVLFPMDDYLTSSGYPMYDVRPDDQRFVMLRFAANAGTELILVENFFEELKQRMPN